YGDNTRCHPYVLMNYSHTIDSMFTLAHEMGHAMHSYLANKTQPHPKTSYSVFVAEVASTLNEGLMFNYLMDKSTDDGERLYLLDRHLTGTMGTFYHQIMYARFELTIHEHVEKGGALSKDFLNELWAELTKKYYGPEILMDDATPMKWSRIPHFYNAFYVFQYATSFAASQMILRKFVAGEKGIISDYLKMLASGGSDYPIELLKICGVDMSKPEAVSETMAKFESSVDEVDRLTD
ncbi:MAG: M3 family metallopeptidase, partial [candidate division Zixibacteria bacterium]